MYLADKFVNLVAGLGTERDKTSHGHFTHQALTKAELDALYASSWLAGKIVDAPCDDQTREWRQWNAGPRQISAIEAEEKRLLIRRTVNTAMKMGRLYGGAALLLGDGAADPTKSLDPATIKRGGLKYVHALSRYEIWASELDRDPQSETFGQPQYYQIATPTNVNGGAPGEGVIVHPSRVIRFFGQARLEMSQTFDGWGLSSLQRCYDAIRNVEATSANLAALTYEAKVDIIKLKGLTARANDPSYRSAVISRFGLSNTTKSNNNAVLIDADEEWNQKQVHFGSFDGVLTKYLEIAAGAADIPTSRLIGIEPKGLNANGDNQVRNYYDMLAGRQRVELSPQLEMLDECLIRSAIGSRPENVSYEWKSLWQMTEAEAAGIALQKAQTTDIYATMPIAPKDVLAKAIVGQLVEDNIYPGLRQALEEAAGQANAPLIEPAAQVQKAPAKSTPGKVPN